MSDLFNDNIKLVYSLAKRYASEELDHEDVVQDGKLGLFLATKTFDPSKDVAFTTWANYWIKAVILRDQVNFTYLKWPNKKYLIRNKIIQFCRQYQLDHGENPTIESIIAALQIMDTKTPMTDKDILIVYKNMNNYKKYLCNAFDDENVIHQNECSLDTLMVCQCTREDELINNRSIDLAKCIYRLGNFERFIIEKRYLDPNEYTLEEVRDLWYVITKKKYTREWIRQKEKSALRRLKKYLEELDE
jgi:RNA polymerase sigma factor (sigma-70 family)